MAITLYSNNSNASASQPLTVTYTAPAGAFLIAFLDINQADFGNVTTVTANGVAMTHLGDSNIGSACGAVRVYVLGNPPASGSGTVTANFTGFPSASRSLSAVVFTNSNNTDGLAQGSGSSFNQSPYSLTTTVDKDIIVTACVVASNTTPTQPSGYTNIGSTFNDGRAVSFSMAYSPVITPAGAQSGNWTWGGGAIQGLSVALALSPGTFSAASNGLFLVSD